MKKVSRVEFSDRAVRALRRIPPHIVTRLRAWASDVELIGLQEVRKRPGFHDEPLRGQRVGQRSIRLNRAYRAVYVMHDGTVQVVRVIEVSKHEY